MKAMKSGLAEKVDQGRRCYLYDYAGRIGHGCRDVRRGRVPHRKGRRVRVQFDGWPALFPVGPAYPLEVL